MTRLEVYYTGPEGPKTTVFKISTDPYKTIKDFMTNGLNIQRVSDNLYIPPFAIIGIIHSTETSNDKGTPIKS